ncbi:MAG TPA: LPS export ABC transporter permease LptG [Geobacteraceae bacterium]
MKIISRYIASTYLKVLGLCTGSFVAIYLTVDFLEKIARFARTQGAPLHVLLFFLWKIPEIVNQVIPLAVLMATLLTLGILARNSEIIAMRGCGMSLARITSPLLITSLAVSLAALVSGEFIVPKSYAKMKYVEDVLIGKKNPNAFFRQNNIWYRQESLILQAKLFEPAVQVLKGVTIWQTAPGMQPQERIDAAEAAFAGDHWLLRDAVVRPVAEGNTSVATTKKEMPIGLQLKAADLKVLEKYADNMGFLDLRRYCRKLEQGGYDPTRYRTQMHSRLSLPFASLIMSFLGIPFALRSGRTSGIAMGVGLSLGIGFSFFIINAVLLSLGQEGVIPAVVAAWAANTLFAAAAVWLTMTVNR